MSSRPDIIYNEYGMDTGYMGRLRKLRPKAMWVKNCYGGSDLYSPTMNGDVRTVIQGPGMSNPMVQRSCWLPKPRCVYGVQRVVGSSLS
ncbi:unnamed protein product [Aureobasidium pullulans]|nr:unnamed protein product [Aureobasidium pullulans]